MRHAKEMLWTLTRQILRDTFCFWVSSEPLTSSFNIFHRSISNVSLFQKISARLTTQHKTIDLNIGEI